MLATLVLFGVAEPDLILQALFKETGVVVDFEVGDTVVVTTGAWKDTVGVIESINEERQTLTIRVELFGRETPVELNFTEIKKMM